MVAVARAPRRPITATRAWGPASVGGRSNIPISHRKITNPTRIVRTANPDNTTGDFGR